MVRILATTDYHADRAFTRAAFQMTVDASGPMPRTKVFAVGFHKTGTSSLASALVMLGYRIAPPFGVLDWHIRDKGLEIALDLVPRFDAFQDNPWPLLYRELDERYPGSKFILTVRPTDEWIASVVGHFGTATTPMREWIYGVGVPAGNEDVYMRRYEQHNREVREHFADRPHDLLELSVTAGEGWDQLCPFLARDIPDAPFPQVNQAPQRERQSLRRRIRLAARLFMVRHRGWR